MYTYFSDFVGECNVCVPANLLPWYTVSVLNFVGKIFVFFGGKKIHGVLIFVAMEVW